MIKLRNLFETQKLTGGDLKHVVDTMRKNKGWKIHPRKYDIKIGDSVTYKGKQWVVVDGRKDHGLDLLDANGNIEYRVSFREITK